jgi:hypothetical protein
MVDWASPIYDADRDEPNPNCATRKISESDERENEFD